jgi:hypothetical protein
MTKSEMDAACSTYRVRGRGVFGVVEGYLRERGYFEDLVIGGMMLLKRIFRK